MAQKFILGGNKVELSLVKRGRVHVKEEQPTYTSQFVEWTEHYVAQIAAPMYKGRRIWLHTGDEYLLTFYTPKGLYRCNAVIVGQGTQDNLPTASVKMASALEKYQRRQFYRMECIIPMTYAVLSEEQKRLYTELSDCTTEERKEFLQKRIDESVHFLEGMALDISGGGMRFNSEVQQQAGDHLLLCPELPEHLKERIPLLFANVIASRPLLYKEAVYDNRVEYTGLSSTQREALIYYIFQEERAKRKREMEMQ